MSTTDTPKSKRSLILSVAAVAVVVLAAIGVFAFKTKLFPPKTLATLRVGYLPVTGHAKFFVAQEEGFFKDEGLNVQLTEFANSADGLAALRADKLDLGAFGTTAPLVHIAKGADISIIGGVMGEDAAIVVKPENENLTAAEPELSVVESRIPILLIHGLADDNIPPRQSEMIRAHNPSDITLWEVPDAGHCGAVSVGAEEFDKQVLGWFSSHGRHMHEKLS